MALPVKYVGGADSFASGLDVGAAEAHITSIITMAESEYSPVASVSVYENISDPQKPALGVYKRSSSTVERTPLGGLV